MFSEFMEFKNAENGDLGVRSATISASSPTDSARTSYQSSRICELSAFAVANDEDRPNIEGVVNAVLHFYLFFGVDDGHRLQLAANNLVSGSFQGR
ncbi:MAG: hypothetical protein AAFQ65_01530 [Myxococcota bacterium]